MITSFLTNQTRLSCFTRTCQNTLSRRITHAYGRISQASQKNLSKNENIFWWLKKLLLSLPLNSWAKFWETKNGENGLNSEVCYVLVDKKCKKFQTTTRISINAAAMRVCLFVVTGLSYNLLSADDVSPLFFIWCCKFFSINNINVI